MQVSTALAAVIVVSLLVLGVTTLYSPRSGAPSADSSTTSVTMLGPLAPGVTSSTNGGVASASASTTASGSQSNPADAVLGNFSGLFLSSPQHDLFRSQNLWWTLYSNGTDVVYRTSPDGVTWSPPILVRTPGADLAVWAKGEMLYYAATEREGNSTTPYFFYRYGELEPNGTIAWSTAETRVQTQYPLSSYYNSITVDDSGNVWFAGTVESSNASLEVYRNSGNGTGWVQTKVISGGLESSIGSFVPLASGVALIYGGFPDTCCQESPIYITVTSNGGVTWSPPVSPPSRDYYMSYSSAVSIGDTIYVVAPTQSDWALRFWTYTYEANSTSPETTIATAPVADSLSEFDGILVATFVSNSTVYERISTDLGIHWSSPLVISGDEPYATSMTSTLSGDFGTLWDSAVVNGSQEVSSYVRFYSASLAAMTSQ